MFWDMSTSWETLMFIIVWSSFWCWQTLLETIFKTRSPNFMTFNAKFFESLLHTHIWVFGSIVATFNYTNMSTYVELKSSSWNLSNFQTAKLAISSSINYSTHAKLLKIYAGPMTSDGPPAILEWALHFKHIVRSHHNTCHFGVHHNYKACHIPLKYENLVKNMFTLKFGSKKTCGLKRLLNGPYFQTLDWTKVILRIGFLTIRITLLRWDMIGDHSHLKGKWCHFIFFK